MKKPKPDPQLVKWCEALASASRAKTPDMVPPGWLTAAQIHAAQGRDRRNLERKLALLVAAGKAEMREFRVLSHGRTPLVKHFRLL